MCPRLSNPYPFPLWCVCLLDLSMAPGSPFVTTGRDFAKLLDFGIMYYVFCLHSNLGYKRALM